MWTTQGRCPHTHTSSSSDSQRYFDYLDWMGVRLTSQPARALGGRARHRGCAIYARIPTAIHTWTCSAHPCSPEHDGRAMRRRTGLNADKARRLLLKEWQDMAALHLAVQYYLLLRVDAVDLKNRLCNVECDCRDRFHWCPLAPVNRGPLARAPDSMALEGRWRRSSPQHQKRTFRALRRVQDRVPKRSGASSRQPAVLPTYGIGGMYGLGFGCLPHRGKHQRPSRTFFRLSGSQFGC
jgi:hypothetical protein